MLCNNYEEIEWNGRKRERKNHHITCYASFKSENEWGCWPENRNWKIKSSVKRQWCIPEAWNIYYYMFLMKCTMAVKILQWQDDDRTMIHVLNKGGLCASALISLFTLRKQFSSLNNCYAIYEHALSTCTVRSTQ